MIKMAVLAVGGLAGAVCYFHGHELWHFVEAHLAYF
jgi:hypothetical protein